VLRTLWRTGVMGRCPGCDEAPLFRGIYEIPRECGRCGLVYQVGEGSWLGAVAIGYGFGAAFAILAVFAELVWGPIDAIGLDPLWTIAVASVAATAIGYRPAKAIWFALLYRYGFMRWPDGSASGGPPPRAAR